MRIARQINTERERQTELDRESHRETQTETDRQTDRQTDRDTERESITKSKHVLVWKLLLQIFAHLGAFSRPARSARLIPTKGILQKIIYIKEIEEPNIRSLHNFITDFGDRQREREREFWNAYQNVFRLLFLFWELPTVCPE